MNKTTPILNPFDKLLNFMCFTPLGLVALLVLAVLPMIPPFNQEYLIRWLISAALLASLAIAFDFTAGLINIVNFGYAAIMGLGAYTSAILADRIGLTPWLGMLAGGLAAAATGAVIGMITLRLRGNPTCPSGLVLRPGLNGAHDQAGLADPWADGLAG